MAKTSASDPKPGANVRLVVRGLPNLQSFTTSDGIVIDREAGVIFPGADVAEIKAEAARLGVQLDEFTVDAEEAKAAEPVEPVGPGAASGESNK